MKGHVYILYSERKDRFYIGSTALDTDLRITQHLEHFYGKSKFTAVADDWILFLSIECKDLHQARKMEHHIKRMKSRNYIENLKRYPELREKLLTQFC